MLPDKSVLLEQIHTAIQKKSCKGTNGNGEQLATGDYNYNKITTELSNKSNLSYIKNQESIRILEQRIEALEDQNDHLLYFIHFLYENFPELVRNILPLDTLETNKLGEKEQPLKGMENKKNDHPNLTRREEEVLQLMVKGLCAKEIAQTLFISETTVITHKKNLKEKFHARNSVELISKAYPNALHSR